MLDARDGLVARLGSRARRRPSPRVGITLAAVGSGLIVLGALTESGNRLGDGSGSPNRVPGIVISAAVIALGYLLLRFRSGPVATAGVAASALAVPPLLFFATLSTTATPPFSVTAVFFVSSAVWLASYLLGPSRGHGFYLGLALFGIWLFVIEQVEGAFSFPFRLPEIILGSTAAISSTSNYQRVPSTTNIGVISLVFGGGYFAIARLLDRRGDHGVATPFTLAGIVTTFWGILLLANDFRELGTGLAFVAAGITVAVLGATAERRATTWAGGAGVFIGATVLAFKIANDNVDTFAVALVVLGGLTIVVGNLFATAWREPDETEPGPSAFGVAGPATPPSAPTTF